MHRFTDRIGLTFQAVGWSLLRVRPCRSCWPPPAIVWNDSRISVPGVEILATVLFSAALWWLVGHLFLLFTSKNGVGMAHLDWNPLVVRRLRRHLAWYLPVQLR
jgi:potassium-dependent mechanosensitive channel